MELKNRRMKTKPFPYYVGIYSLEELVNKESRVCVINILGTESRHVTPVSHEYSGGNVVAGVQYGRRGTLETRIGEIPVYRSVRDVMDNGLNFDTGVIYLPPLAVSQAVWELVRYNNKLKRIVIITEKVPTRDSRNIRFICQEAGIDVIGANCLGVANAWDHVRIGGALGGDNPEETLLKGSVAIYSNSGNFTTTIAEYLRTAGFGVSTVVSSGKDVYIHFALAEFLFAAQNDPRTRAVALYIEPGGYYEKMALEWIQERRFSFNKPMVVCVTGRWKRDILRSCGHAGAMAGSGDDAESKEQWFDQYLETILFNPNNPRVNKKGVRVASIQQIPDAMNIIYKKIGEKRDFKISGDLSLKLWLGDQYIKLPKDLDLPVIKAIPPYDKRIEEINKQVGANFLRQNMRNKSGVSRINPKTLIAELHNKPVLELAQLSFEENMYYALGKVLPQKNDLRKMNLLLNLFLKIEPEQERMLEMAWTNGCTPNATIASQVALIGDKPLFRQVRLYCREIIDTIREYNIKADKILKVKSLDHLLCDTFLSKEKSDINIPQILIDEARKADRKSAAIQLCNYVFELAESKGEFLQHEEAFCIASILVSMFWNGLLEKRISRRMVEDAIVYIITIAQITTFSIINHRENKFWNKIADQKSVDMHLSFTENLFQILFNREPAKSELIELKYILGLTITNGPGTISAKGSKESVSARNHIPMAFAGFLSNTGLAHGGNGFEAVEFLLDQFKNIQIPDPGKRDNSINLRKMANTTAKDYTKYKIEQKEMGKLAYKRIPCIGHPVFKGNAVNIDPREDFVRQTLEKKSIYNVFLDFYHHLVQELFQEGGTGNVFCVNVDAVIAVITLKLIWKDFQENRTTLKQVQDLVFILFLLGRSIGIVAEIIDHRDRGLDMDCRTPQNEVGYIL